MNVLPSQVEDKAFSYINIIINMKFHLEGGEILQLIDIIDRERERERERESK